jgi:hypothetical protein
MTPGEVARLLAAAAMFDYRKIEKADAQAWHFVLGDLDFDDAMEALRRHYAESTERLMPAHVRHGVRAIRDERRRQQPSEVRALPSRFEDDADRSERARRGSAQVHEVLAELSRRMQARGEHVPGDAMQRLRELTDGPAWPAEIEQAGR